MSENISASPTSGLAISSLAFGGLGSLFLFASQGPISAFLGLVAVCCAIQSLRLIKKGQAAGRDMAIAGLVLGAVGLFGGLGAMPSSTTTAAPTTAASSTATYPAYSYTQPTYAASAPVGPTATTIPGDGTFFVGSEIKPGTYRTAGAKQQAFTFCQFSRLRGTTGGSGDTISWATASANDPSVITIAASDQAFRSSGCEQWIKVK